MSPHTPRRARPAPARRPLLALALMASLAGAASGCESRDENARVLSDAAVRLDVMTGGGAVPAPNPERAKAELAKLVNELRPIAGESGPSGAAANALLARAQAGLGDLAAGRSAEMEREFVSQLSTVRATLDRWFAQNSLAAALEGYDPAREIAAIDGQIRDRTSEMESLAAEKRKQEGVVAGLRDQARQAREAAKAERDKDAALRGRAEGATQVQRLDLVSQAVRAGRAADAQERRASELEAQAGTEEPRVAELGAQTERLTRQVELLRSAQGQARARAEANKRQADEARKGARAAAEALAEQLGAISALRAKADEPIEEARKQYAAAIGAAKKGGSAGGKEGKQSSQSSLANYQQSLGDAQSTRARSLAAYAGVLRSVGEARPALPGADAAAQGAAKAVSDMDGARKEAGEAYQAAKGLYSGMSATPVVKARLERLAKDLESLATLGAEPPKSEPAHEEPAPGGEKPAGEAAPATGETPAGGTPSGAAPALAPDVVQRIEGEVHDAAARFSGLLRSHDVEAVRGAMEFADDQARELFDAAVPTLLSMDALDGAVKAKFGKDLATAAKESQDPAVKMSPATMMWGSLSAQGAKLLFTEEQARSAPVKVKSETEAALTLPQDAGDPTTFVKRDGAWKMLAKTKQPSASPAADMMKQLLPKLRTVMDELKSGVDAGQFASAEDVLKAIGPKVLPLMGPNIPGGRGGGATPGRPGGARPKPAGTPGSPAGDKPSGG